MAAMFFAAMLFIFNLQNSSAQIAAEPAAVAADNPTVDEQYHHRALYATLWMQAAVEYRAAAQQTYVSAAALLEKAKQDPQWTAAPEQTADFARKPPAIIVDVDETVLDNSPYQAWLIQSGQEYSSATWKQWCEAAEAEAIPGALEFTKKADQMGIVIFYVSNRTADVETVTRANLARLGFPLRKDEDPLLFKGEREEWGSPKGSRRALVAESYRIVMLFGDNLGDFVENYKSDAATREKIVRDNADKWGVKWFMLPNPTYGSWADSLFGYDYSQPQEVRMEKVTGGLRPWSGPKE